ncbi:MAG TPA: hemerythrin domain-containing protein [Usitatibacter sp.]|nr:hemerythrin domain-containing protein [Usitatibacter sp.]
MDTLLFPTPAAAFDEPIEIIDGCHQRIRRQCALIMRISEHVALKGADAEAAEAATRSIRYFEDVVGNHHRDEEEDLFPLLFYTVPSDDLNALRALLFRLRSEHRKLELQWADIRERLDAIAGGNDIGLARDLAKGFADAYDAHIAFEELHLLPLARRVLDEQHRARLGARMARRRKPGSDHLVRF